ncbi:MAG: hypothetical protein M1817_003112 [Caeruleum heppii]|nr:MAG: hypothetical protein M1817_003112 [Caeruleum heppii]
MARLGRLDQMEGSSATRLGQWKLLGPEPTLPPSIEVESTALNATDPSADLSPMKPSLALGLPTCGSTCQSNIACRRDGAPSSCRCLAVGEAVARAVGSDPVFPAAMCLVFSQALVSQLAGVGKGLRARADEGIGISEEDDIGCVCNRTYVSRACCESETGLVYENQEKRLGRLEELA